MPTHERGSCGHKTRSDREVTMTKTLSYAAAGLDQGVCLPRRRWGCRGVCGGRGKPRLV